LEENIWHCTALFLSFDYVYFAMHNSYKIANNNVNKIYKRN